MFTFAWSGVVKMMIRVASKAGRSRITGSGGREPIMGSEGRAWGVMENERSKGKHR